MEGITKICLPAVTAHIMFPPTDFLNALTYNFRCPVTVKSPWNCFHIRFGEPWYMFPAIVTKSDHRINNVSYSLWGENHNYIFSHWLSSVMQFLWGNRPWQDRTLQRCRCLVVSHPPVSNSSFMLHRKNFGETILWPVRVSKHSIASPQEKLMC